MKAQVNTVDYKSVQFANCIEHFRFYNFDTLSTLNLNPEGHFEFIFQLQGDFSQKSIAEQNEVLRPRQFIGGLHSKSFQVKSLKPQSRILSIKFKPLGARSFISERLNVFKNELVDLDFLNPKMLDFDLENSSDQDIIKQLETSLSKVYKTHSKNVVDCALELMTASRGFLSIKKMAQQLNISESYFRFLFNEQVGMSPKEYSKILRVNYIAKELICHQKTTLTEMAYQLNYYDQSHFIKDFKSVTGLSPKAYRKAQ